MKFCSSNSKSRIHTLFFSQSTRRIFILHFAQRKRAFFRRHKHALRYILALIFLVSDSAQYDLIVFLVLEFNFLASTFLFNTSNNLSLRSISSGLFFNHTATFATILSTRTKTSLKDDEKVISMSSWSSSLNFSEYSERLPEGEMIRFWGCRFVNVEESEVLFEDVRIFSILFAKSTKEIEVSSPL